MVDVDNMRVFHAFRIEQSKNALLHELITTLFWLQVNTNFTLNLPWVRSADNKEADGLSRSEKEITSG